MSRVYIDGLKAPKNCKYCSFNRDDIFCAITSGYIDRDDYSNELPCPIHNVPHSVKLIDANALFERAKEVAYPVVYDTNSHERGLTITGIEQLITEQEDYYGGK